MRIGFIVAAGLAASTGLVMNIASADEAANPKAGLWEVSKAAPEIKGGVRSFKECFGDSYQDILHRLGADPELSRCTKHELKQTGGVITIDSDCTEVRAKVASHTTATLDGDAKLHIEMQAKYDPPLMGEAESHRTLDAKWLSACQPGMKPGDVLSPDGKIYNLDVLRQRGFSKNFVPPPPAGQ